MSGALLGGHPYTCDLAAAGVAVVAMHVVEVPGAHDAVNVSRRGRQGQLCGEFGLKGGASVG